ncbi:MAG: hypothetical protein ACTSRR_04610 [Candidatus Heimdallarchaeaceae archaeon]
MDYYQIAKLAEGSILLLIAVITLIIGRRNSSIFYVNWFFFTLTFSAYQFTLYFEYSYQTLTLYQMVQTTRAFFITILLGSTLQQSRIFQRKSTFFFMASVTIFMLYIIWVPLAIKETVETFRDVQVVLFHTIRTDIFGLIFGLLIILSATFLLPIIVRNIKIIRSSKFSNKLVTNIIMTFIVIICLFALGGVTIARRAQMLYDVKEYKIAEIFVELISVSFTSIYLSQSQSHGIQAVLIVDREGNPILGYSPLKREKISFEEKIIAASGFLSSLFMFVKNYVASSKNEEFKELKTTNSSLLFYSGEKFFLIVQTYLTSSQLDIVSERVLREIDFYLSSLPLNEMPDEKQRSDLFFLLDKNFYLLA